MKKPFTLARDPVSHDAVAALEFLLQEARRGELIGIAYGAMMKSRECIVDTAGEAHRNPLFALGVVCMLSDDIALRARNGQNE
jgi:hypothetical protein